jgi:lipopolysaccharide/colanic/teichoic acid biosynthesis glycosyltransferase
MSIDRYKLLNEPGFIDHATLPQQRPVPHPFGKRLVDILLALIGLLIVTPLTVTIAALLSLESPGQVIFRQQRLGRGGKQFTLYKFRKFPALWNDDGPAVTVGNDARMTAIGAVLERTKLDELPQLWNIIKGDMSVVGPRPESLRFADLYVDQYREILNYRPGLFGPGMVRNEGDLYPPGEDPEEFYRRVLFVHKADRDLAYYPTATVWSDLVWIVKGVWESIVGTVNWRRTIARQALTIVSDVVLVMLGWTLTNLFRFSGFPQSAVDFDNYVAGLWIFPLFFVVCALVARCYHYSRSHFYLVDGLHMLTAFTIAWAGGFVLLYSIGRHVSLYLFPMGWFVVFSLLAFGRLAIRISSRTPQNTLIANTQSEKILLYGVGGGGVALSSWLEHSLMDVKVVGFVDDTSEGERIRGVRFLGGERDLPTIQSVHNLNGIWMTFLPDHAKRRRLEQFCERNRIELVILPLLDPFKRFSGSQMRSDQ